MLSLHLGRVALIRFWKPTPDDDHLISSDYTRTATSVRVRSGTIVGREYFDPRKGRKRKDVGVVVSERISETVSTIQVTILQSALIELATTCVHSHVV